MLFVDLLKIKTVDTTVATTDSGYGTSTASDTTTDAATDGDTTTYAATAGGVSTENADADKATVRLTTVARIAADWAKTVSTDSILFCGFCAFKCKHYLLYKYYVDIFKTYEKYYLN